MALALTALAVSAAALVAQRGLARDERAAWQSEAASLRRDVGRRLDRLENRSARLTGRLDTTERTLAASRRGIAPLAKRVLKSVFTVETDEGYFGTGFVGWTEDGASYIVTAHHVVDEAARPVVTVTRTGGSWSGNVVRVDPKNDLALIRVSGRPAHAAPLWQRPKSRLPKTGDQLLLVGSPYGLEGTVTTGVVSRVRKRMIQTDAAANPGNSGGPALDREGNIVGVLLAGGGQNINFAVPIQRACMRLRDC